MDELTTRRVNDIILETRRHRIIWSPHADGHLIGRRVLLTEIVREATRAPIELHRSEDQQPSYAMKMVYGGVSNVTVHSGEYEPIKEFGDYLFGEDLPKPGMRG